jgi:cyclopropane fatty-acyl-phospholipid synthase-like methyltransferase
MTSRCLACDSTHLYENSLFSALPRVTSDCVPFAAGGRIAVCLDCGLIQKPTDDAWKKDIAAIYGAYAMYSLTEGSDQILFSSGGTRADTIAAILQKELPADFAGHVIDIGCGTGGFLKAFGARFKKARLYGKEISDSNLKYLEKIPNFQTLYTADGGAIEQRFDLITSIHCFEHLYEYRAFFDEIAAIRTPDTKVFLQVPDIATSPFDLVIADHAGHFSRETLHACLGRYVDHYEVHRHMDKELSAIIRPHASHPTPDGVPARTATDHRATLDAHVDYLAGFLAHIDQRAGARFGVYGTTIAGAWLASAFGDRIACYVDDDSLKHGKKLFGKDVVPPSSVPEGLPIVMPFGAATRQKILRANPHLADNTLYFDRA